MFGGDDSFDVDDEDFLKLALNVERQSQGTPGHINDLEQDDSTKTTVVEKVGSVQSKTSLRPRHVNKIQDPLGLNKILLNKKHLQEADPSSSEPSDSQSTSESESSKTDLTKTANISNHVVDTPSPGGKKFVFKPSSRISPVSEITKKLSPVSKEDTRVDKEVNRKPSISTNKIINSKEPQIDQANNLFDIDQDIWNSDLDLSATDGDELVSWQPGQQVQVEAVSSSRGEKNLAQSSDKFTKGSNDNVPEPYKSALRASTMRKVQEPSIQQPLKNIQNTVSNGAASKIAPAGNPPLASQASSKGDESFKTPQGTNHRRSLCSKLVDKNANIGSTCIQTITTTSLPWSSSSLTAVSGLTTPSKSNINNNAETPTSRSDGSSIATPSSSKASVCSSGKRKRKFPGPAGVLPKLHPGLSLDAMNVYKPASPRITEANKQLPAPPDSQVPSSQTTEDRFQDGPWTLMLDDLEPQAQAILEEYSIANILTKAQKRMLLRSKVPVLCVLLTDISLQTSEASVQLRDKTGEMKGTVHRSVIKEYQDEMHIGAVLVLRQVGVFSPSGRNFYLNITPNNLVRIYSRGSDASQGVVAKRVTRFSEEDFRIPDPVSAPQTPQSVRPGLRQSGPRTPLQSPVLPRQSRPQLWTPQPRPGIPQRFSSGGNPSFRTSTPQGPRLNRMRSFTPRAGTSASFTPKTAPNSTFTPRAGPSSSFTPWNGPNSMPRGGFTPQRPRSSVPESRPPVMRSNNVDPKCSSSIASSSESSNNNNRFTFNRVTPSNLKTTPAPPIGHSSVLDRNSKAACNGSGNRSEVPQEENWQDDHLDDLLRDLDDDMMMDV